MARKYGYTKDKTGNTFYPYPYFPVGYIYISRNEIDLNAIYGGTWEQIKDVFLLAAGDSYSAGSTGGEAEHTLTTSEIPPIPIKYCASGAGSNTGGYFALGSSASGGTTYINHEASGGSHNNMPPYIAVYVYQKVAD